MVAQRNEVVLRDQNFIYRPNSYNEFIEYCTLIASSNLCPEALRGRPKDVAIVVQTGAELGLSTFQSLRTLGVINGMPYAYGTGLLGLVKRHSSFEDMKEWFEGDIDDDSLIAYSSMTRRNQTPIVNSFSIKDAMRAKLWNKKHRNGADSTWVLYAKRMLMHRARGFTANDAFPDALFGLKLEHEAYEIAEREVTLEPMKPVGKGTKGMEEALGIQPEPDIIDAEVILEPVHSKLDELKELISSRKVTKGSITVTLKKFGVVTLEELTDEMIDKWSNHLKTRESK